MNTFNRARLKLTAWYLLIIMLVSLMFSAIIYQSLTIEINRFEQAQRFYIEQQLQDNDDSYATPPRPRRIFVEGHIPLNPELISQTKRRIMGTLAVINLGILFISGGLGYVLAGRTLRPIKRMLDEQYRFISDASHELKTPLTALRAEFEVALLDVKKMTSTQTKELLTSGLEEIVNLQTLAERLLTLVAHTNVKRITFDKIPVKATVEAAIKKVAPQAKKKKIEIKQEIGSIEICADERSFVELVTILVENAVKYSPDKSSIYVTAVRQSKQMLLTVRDEGQGIEKQEIEHIFDRFYRVDESRSTVDGFGLGLSIAKRIVTEHGGAIHVQSKKNDGTTFVVTLPIASS